MDIGRGAAETVRAGGTAPELNESVASWDHYIRDGVVEQARRALMHGRGAVLEGAPGAGKASLAATVLDSIRDRAHVIELDRHELGREDEGLGALLSRLPAADPAGRRTIMEAVRERIAAASGGLPAVLHIPDHTVVRDEMTGVLAALALSGTFSILMIARNDGDGNVPKLAQSVRLERIYLEALSLDETQMMLRRVLRGEPSRAAAFALWSGAAGHRRLLEALARDWHDSGFLSFVQGVWVVAGNHWPVGGRARRVWQDLLGDLADEQREVVELVALAHRIPLHELLAVVAARDIDIVHGLGYLEFGGGHLRRVKLRGTCSAPAVAEQVPPGRAAILLERLRAKATVPRPVDAVHLYSWEVAAGFTPPAELALEAAEHCLGVGDVHGALGFLDGAADMASDARYLDTYLRALQGAGHMERAREVLEQHGLVDWAFDGSGSDIAQVARFLGSSHEFEFALTSLQMAAEARHEADEVLHGILLGLLGRIGEARQAGEAAPQVLGERAATVRLRLLELASRRGRPSWCAAFQYSLPGLDGPRLWRWQLLLNSTAVSAGEVKIGIQRGRELTLLVHHMASSGTQRLATRLNLFGLYMVAGEWAAAAEVIDGSWVGGHESSRLDDASNLYAGVLLALQGHSADALGHLENDLVQRRVFDAERVYGVGLAAAAYASACLGGFEDAERFLYALEEAEAAPRRPDNLVMRSIGHFRALTVVELGRLGEGIDALMSAAQEDRADGRISWELLALSAAARLGHEPAFVLLEERAQASTGRFAAACRQYAGAHLNRDPSAMHAAVRAFDLLGHPGMGATAGGPGPARKPKGGTVRPAAGARPGPEAFRAHDGQGPAARTAGRGGLPDPARPHAPEATQWLPGPTGGSPLSALTARQMDIARLAAQGKSNKEIADGLGLSVRTVESHLYQIYSRLGVAGREGLAYALTQSGD